MRKDHCSALKIPHSSVLKHVVELETQDTPQTHDLWHDNKYSSEFEFGLADLIDWTWFLSF